MTSKLVPIQVTDTPLKGADATVFHIHAGTANCFLFWLRNEVATSSRQLCLTAAVSKADP